MPLVLLAMHAFSSPHLFPRYFPSRTPPPASGLCSTPGQGVWLPSFCLSGRVLVLFLLPFMHASTPRTTTTLLLCFS